MTVTFMQTPEEALSQAMTDSLGAEPGLGNFAAAALRLLEDRGWCLVPVEWLVGVGSDDEVDDAKHQVAALWDDVEDVLDRTQCA